MSLTNEAWAATISFVSTVIAFIAVCVPVLLHVHGHITQNTKELDAKIELAKQAAATQIALERENASRLRHERNNEVQKCFSEIESRLRVVEKLPNESDIAKIETNLNARMAEMWNFLRELGNKMERLTSAIDRAGLDRREQQA